MMKNKLKRASDGAACNGWIMSQIIYGGSAVEIARSSRSIPLYIFIFTLRFGTILMQIIYETMTILVYTMGNFKELVLLVRVLLTPFSLQNLHLVRQSSIRGAFVTCKLFANAFNCNGHKREKSLLVCKKTIELLKKEL